MGARFYFEILDDALAIADLGSRKFILLNAPAGLIWLNLNEGPSSIKALAEIFSNFQQLDQSFSVEQMVRKQLEEWVVSGWVQHSDDGLYRLLDEIPCSASNSKSDELKARSDWGSLGASVISSFTVSLNQQPLKLEMWSSCAPEECDFLSRWSGMVAGLPSSIDATQATFAYWQRGDDSVLDCNGSLHTTSDSASASAILFDAILHFSFPATIGPISIHAAAVSQERGTILMPAESGSGKSTLTAALIARGWHYGGDDIVGVARETSNPTALRVLPFPTAIGLKEGSWMLLSNAFPQLKRAIEVTYNEKRVRFLPVCKEFHIPDSALHRRLIALVVPCYDPAVQCQLSSISCSEAFTAIVEAGAGSGNILNVEGITTLMDVARTVPAYRLRYSDFAKAERCLKGLS